MKHGAQQRVELRPC